MAGDHYTHLLGHSVEGFDGDSEFLANLSHCFDGSDDFLGKGRYVLAFLPGFDRFLHKPPEQRHLGVNRRDVGIVLELLVRVA